MKLLLKTIAFLVIGFFVLIGGILTLQYFEEEAERKRIPIKQVTITGLELKPDTFGYKLVGKIQNKSREYTLTSVRLEVRITDTLPNGTSSVIGQATSWYDENIPPGQVRQYEDSTLSFQNMPKAEGTLSWDYELIGTTGRK